MKKLPLLLPAVLTMLWTGVPGVRGQVPAVPPGQSNANAAATAPGQTKPPEEKKPVTLAEERVGQEAARQLARTGKPAEAEAALGALNAAKPETAEWHLETARRLVQAGESLAREGRAADVSALMIRAVAQLAQAESRAKDAGERASAKSLAGFVQERYLADPVAARASYAAAGQLAPGEAGKAAREAAERLQRADERLKEKLARGGN